jgi:short-subunit dehydrogenase
MMVFKEYERYALVTGAASGMGRIYCQELALKGYNVVMVDINDAGLDQTAQIVKEAVEVSDKVPAQMKEQLKLLKVVQDLSVLDAADKVYQATEAAGCEVEVLVNNAGVMYCQGIAETSERMLRLSCRCQHSCRRKKH